MKQASSNAAARGSLSTVNPCRGRLKLTRRPSREWFEGRKLHGAAKLRELVGGISWKFEIRQPHALIHDLIRSNTCRSFESFGATVRYIIVLIYAVAAHTQPTD